MLRRHVFVVLAALAPAGALAQTAGQVTFTENDAFINKVECEDASQTVTLNWQLQGTFVAGGTLTVYASNTAPDSTGLCPTRDDANNNVSAGQVASRTNEGGASGTLDVSTSTIAAEAGFACTESRQTVHVCVHYAADGTTTTAQARGTMVLQTAAPNAPTLDSVDRGDGRLRANWTEATTGEDATRFIVTATASGEAAHRSGELVGSNGFVEGLTNGTTYVVQVIALSEGKNESPASNPIPETPAATVGFWDTYEDQGGVEAGGCQAGGAGALALLAVAALALGRRRS